MNDWEKTTHIPDGKLRSLFLQLLELFDCYIETRTVHDCDCGNPTCVTHEYRVTRMWQE